MSATTGAAFAAVLLATGAMRLVELGVSVRRLRARPDALVPEPALFPAMAGLHAALVALPLLELWAFDRPFRPWLAVAAALVLVAATALRVWTLRTIGRSWNVRVVAPEVVTTGGPYQYIRHPNYLCVILELAALPLLHGCWLAALALGVWNAAVLAVRIRTEEAMLIRNDAWRDHFSRRARLVPGVF